MTSEEWRLLAISPNYEISTKGQIRNRKTGYVLRPFVMNKRVGVSIRTDGRDVPIYVARQMLFTFSRPNEWKSYSDVVGYHDGNKLNVKIDNLYWQRSSDVRKKAWREGKYKNRRQYRFTAADLKKAVERRLRNEICR